MRESSFDGIVLAAALTICAISVGTSAWAINKNLQTIATVRAQDEDRIKNLDEAIQSSKVREAYQLGAFYEVLCNSPKLNPYTKDTTPCVAHFARMNPPPKSK
ncbi:MAG: hypothetical protein EOP83_14335 [Verrucomicrobiaceae bacterium]|nr:MAG: hypothetical protein EOP83_14335 [Verrucomicrobiaceae bacterium]